MSVFHVDLHSYFFLCAESGVAAKVVAAVDVNTTANEIYKHNFPNTPLLPKTIEVSTLRPVIEVPGSQELPYCILNQQATLLGHT